MRVYIHGREHQDWAIDRQNLLVTSAATHAGYTPAKWAWTARLIHSVWWNRFVVAPPFYLRHRTRLLLFTSNFINLDHTEYELRETFDNACALNPVWVASSSMQARVFERHGIRAARLPQFLDFDAFTQTGVDLSKDDLHKRYGIPAEKTDGRFIIGSFQRDSLGSDLSKPKWQKGPELLIRLLRGLPRERILLLLAGPRRHYVRNQCKEHGIPYHYIGEETERDDVKTNILPISEMPYLYRLCDLYLVTSASEGGPLAVLEAAATKTPILSTDVGLAADYLPDDAVFSNADTYEKRLQTIVAQADVCDSLEAIRQHAYAQCRKTQTKDAQATALRTLYEDVLAGKY